jgi:hypothetical protein
VKKNDPGEFVVVNQGEGRVGSRLTFNNVPKGESETIETGSGMRKERGAKCGTAQEVLAGDQQIHQKVTPTTVEATQKVTVTMQSLVCGQGTL